MALIDSELVIKTINDLIPKLMNEKDPQKRLEIRNEEFKKIIGNDPNSEECRQKASLCGYFYGRFCISKLICSKCMVQFNELRQYREHLLVELSKSNAIKGFFP